LVSLVIRLQLHTPNHRKRELRKTGEKEEQNRGTQKNQRRKSHQWEKRKNCENGLRGKRKKNWGKGTERDEKKEEKNQGKTGEENVTEAERSIGQLTHVHQPRLRLHHPPEQTDRRTEHNRGGKTERSQKGD
jgi:hypothetical protein